MASLFTRNTLRGLLGQPVNTSISVVADRFLKVFHEHGVATSQIARLLPEVRLGDLTTTERLVAVLTPELIDRVAKLFGVRSQWLEGYEDRIYEYLATDKQPQCLLDHLRSLLRISNWREENDTPIRILATTANLDYRKDGRHDLAPILIEPIATLGEQKIYRYHVYQDGFCWDHFPARIELKAIALAIYQFTKMPIPLYPISREDMEDVLEGRRIPKSLLGGSLITNPSFEDYVEDRADSVVAKETEERPEVLQYMFSHGLDTYSFAAEPIVETAAPETESAPAPQPVTSPDNGRPAVQGKRQAARENWQAISTVATAIWSNEPLLIQHMVKRLRKVPNLKTAGFTDDTIRKQIAPLAPEGIRGKSGRKPNKLG